MRPWSERPAVHAAGAAGVFAYAWWATGRSPFTTTASLVSARRAARQHRVRRPLTVAELLAVVRLSQLRWLLLAGWLWMGWHLFARVHWR